MLVREGPKLSARICRANSCMRLTSNSTSDPSRGSIAVIHCRNFISRTESGSFSLAMYFGSFNGRVICSPKVVSLLLADIFEVGRQNYRQESPAQRELTKASNRVIRLFAHVLRILRGFAPLIPYTNSNPLFQ